MQIQSFRKYSRLPETFVKQVKVIIRKGSTFTHKCKVDETISDEFLIPFIHYVYKMNLSYIKKRMKAHSSIFYMLVKMICMKKWEKKECITIKNFFKDYQILRQKY